MLDILESFGLDLDGLDSDHSLRLHSRLFPNAPPQSICSRVIELEMWYVAGIIGFWHCVRSWERYR